MNGTRGETPSRKVHKKGVGNWLFSKLRRRTTPSETDRPTVPGVELDGPVGQGSPNEETGFMSSGIFLKKTAANGLMDFAFLTANANQLAQTLSWRASDNQSLIIVLISISIVLQVLFQVHLLYSIWKLKTIGVIHLPDPCGRVVNRYFVYSIAAATCRNSRCR